jgi:transcription elongation factor Elf1
MIANRLRNFKQKNDYLWNFSCPICGDSSTNKTKARAFIYKSNGDLFVKCHNCGYVNNLGNLIKHLDSYLYKEYVFEKYKSNVLHITPTTEPTTVETPPVEVELSDDLLDPLVCIAELPPTHPAVKYVEKRKIPKSAWGRLYFAPKFKAYVNWSTGKKTFPEPIQFEHPRMIIPFYNNHGKVFAYQGRAYGDETPKYLTVKIDDVQEKIYGLDIVNYAKPIYVVEGPIDSLFLPNAIAVSGASFDTPIIRSLKANCTLVMDNEPRNKDIVKQLKKYIDSDYKVCMFPDSVDAKDINDLILLGYTSDEIINLINTNTFTGIEAKLKFATWRKC